MVTTVKERIIEQLRPVIVLYEEMRSNSNYDDDLSGVSDGEVHEFISRCRAAITRITGPKSTYIRDFEGIMKVQEWHGSKANKLGGVIKGLKADVEAGYLQNFEEIIHGDVFSDFLEMAEHLLDEGYKDAAAVIAGSSLEGHLRQLCGKFDVETETSTVKGLKPKTADRMNADLAKAEAYEKLDLKNVTAWLDLRNKAAHGKYDEYKKEQVAIQISGIRDFITRITA